MEADKTTALFLALALMVAAARLGGGLARRLGQPRVLGELLVGLLLGPSVLDMLHWPVFSGMDDLRSVIGALAELGVLLLMFIVGLEVNIAELAKVRGVALTAGVLGVLAPILLTLPVALLAGYGLQPALFAGVVLAATSVSISAQVLLELGLLRSKEGSVLLATALVDDILALLVLSLVLAFTGTQGGTGGDVVVILLRTGFYLVGAVAVAWYLLPRLTNWIAAQPSAAQSHGIAALAFIVALIFAWSAQEIGGIAPITGAFIAGVGLRRTKEHVRHEIEAAVTYPAYGLLVPVFFLNVGLHTDLHTFQMSALPFAIVLLLAAIISKVGGCGIGAKVCGYTNQEALRIGVCMISRGEVGLIIASLGIATGIFRHDDPLFTSLFLVILLTTLLTPVLVRQVFPRPAGEVKHA